MTRQGKYSIFAERQAIHNCRTGAFMSVPDSRRCIARRPDVARAANHRRATATVQG
jgi:hypothetical protein